MNYYDQDDKTVSFYKHTLEFRRKLGLKERTSQLEGDRQNKEETEDLCAGRERGAIVSS